MFQERLDLLIDQRLMSNYMRHCVQATDWLCHGSMPGFILRAESCGEYLTIEYKVIGSIHVALSIISSVFTGDATVRSEATSCPETAHYDHAVADAKNVQEDRTREQCCDLLWSTQVLSRRRF